MRNPGVRDFDLRDDSFLPREAENGASPSPGMRANWEASSFALGKLGDVPQSVGDDIADDISSSTTLAIGGSLSTNLNANVDKDFFQVNLVAGQTYVFTMSRAGSAPALDTFLELRTAGGALIEENDDGGIGTNSLLMYTATTTGTHFLSAGSWQAQSSGAYTVTAQAIETGPSTVTTFGFNGKPQYSWTEAAYQLTREGASWAQDFGQSAVVTYSFRSDAPATMPSDTTGFSRFNATQIAAAEAALQAWGQVANITFVRVGSGTTGDAAYSNDATIVFANYSGGQAGASAFAYLPSSGNAAASSVQGDVWVNNSIPTNADPVSGQVGYHVLMHEIGHALGLSHPGDYDAEEGVSITYAANAEYHNDSRLFTVMSYFATTAVGGAWPVYPGSPQLHDIAAIQRLYGANTSTRAGDTVYGFNSNTGRPEFTITSPTQGIGFTVWDGGGIDTLDFSGFSDIAYIDLREESFMNVGPSNPTYNVVIARGSVIENAIGGSGADLIRGNAVANTIRGGGGGDSIYAGLGNDSIYGDAGSDGLYGEEGNDAIYGGDGGDTVYGGDGDDTVYGDADNDSLWGEAGNDTLYGGLGNDGFRGGDGDDILWGEDGNDNMGGDGGNDTLDGGGGDDTLVAGFGDDVGYGRDGADTLFAGAGNDRMYGGLGADGVYGEGGDDELYGDDGADSVSGGDGADRLFGGAGDDVLTGGVGNDFLDGGVGDDKAVFDIGLSGAQVVRYGSIQGVVSTALGSDRLTGVETLIFNGVNYATSSFAEFDALNYVAGYNDLINVFGADLDAAVEHFLRSGYFEGRDTVHFDGFQYLASYNDLINAFGSDGEMAARHFIQYGLSGGRSRDAFDGTEYIASHNDLIVAFGLNEDMAARHYVQYGYAAGRARDTFDGWQYLASYDDLILHMGADVEGAARQFVRSGYAEGRSRDVYNWLEYIAGHDDLILAYGADETAGARHFVESGFADGRQRDSFDGLQYIASYGDLIQFFGENEGGAASHFIQFGYAEGRSRDSFDAAQYVANYADLQAVFGDDLYNATRHYILFGYAEGRTDEDLTPNGGDDGLALVADKGPSVYVSPVEFDTAALDKGDAGPAVLPGDMDFGALRLAVDDGFLMRGLGETPADLRAKGIVMPPEWAVLGA